MNYLSPDDMFRGKNLPLFLERYQDDLHDILSVHGQEKFERVYNWVFREIGKLQWGQWWVLDKVCPKEEDRHLFFYILELIYQSTLLCRLRFERVDDVVRIHVDAPSEIQQERLGIFFADRKYVYVDWYNRYKYDPLSYRHIKPEWFGLEVASEDIGDVGDELPEEAEDN